MTYRTKILILFITISILPLLLIMIYFMGPYTIGQEKRLSYLMESIIWQKRNSLVTEFTDYQKILSSMMTNKEITESLHDLSLKGRSRAADSVNIIRSFFTDSLYLKNEIIGFLYYNPDNGLYVSYNRLNVQDTQMLNYILEHAPDFTNDIESMQDSLTHLATFEVEDINGNMISVFLLAEKFLDANRLEFNGYIFMMINEEKLNALINAPYLDNSIFTRTFLLNASNTITVSNSSGLTNTKYSRDMYKDASLYLDSYLSLGKADLSLVTIYRKEDLYGNRLMFILIPLLIVCITAIIAIAAINNYLTKILQYMEEINKSMTLSNNQVHFTLKNNTDLALVAQKFEQMKLQLNTLLVDQQEKTIMLLKNEEQRRIAEIKAIEAQVNPHFLYNILNTLNWIALDQKDIAVSKGITTLASLLRYSLSQIDTMATVAEEVQWIENYLSLQSLRYDDLFSYTLTWDHRLAEIKIFKLLLQPFIENSITHGFSGIPYKGRLEINIQVKNQHLCITIMDNGKGFDPAVRKKSTGLESATSRIKLYYGQKASLNITSEPKKQTVVTIVIPKHHREESR